MSRNQEKPWHAKCRELFIFIGFVLICEAVSAGPNWAALHCLAITKSKGVPYDPERDRFCAMLLEGLVAIQYRGNQSGWNEEFAKLAAQNLVKRARSSSRRMIGITKRRPSPCKLWS